ncbi:hypothetical protein BN2475_470062 [Paraburkholderia ribeironis]|uniref:Uncharacterized protein n=1 Tax=Paraburkholderia ribeironis TaxID=1247936 RepID=A0A1N7SA53_9BURK|nr:hypothetical protein BN2475_470062 [Paraburkholderia ribeironis]
MCRAQRSYLHTVISIAESDIRKACAHFSYRRRLVLLMHNFMHDDPNERPYSISASLWARFTGATCVD